MAKVFLDANDEFVISGPATIYGSTGIEKLQIANGATGVVLDSAVERIELAGASTAYNYKIEGTQITVYSGTTEVASFAGGNNPILAFSDGSAAVAMTGLGTATLGGVAIPTAAAPITPTVDAADPSTAPGVAGTFSLTADAASVNEGATATFTVAHGQPNQTYNYELTGVDAADVVGGLLTGSITTDTNGSATFSVALANDRATESVETLKATLPNTGLSATVTVNDTSLDNVAPVAQDATGATTEAGAVVTGQLVATDAENDALTFTPDAAVEGLTLNTDGTYTFDPSQNTAAQALTYKSDPLAVTANYTVTDALDATDTGTLTITVTPKPLTFSLVPSAAFVEEGSTVTYKLVASEPVQDGFTGTIQVSAGDGTAGKTQANDFGSGSLTPVNVTIAAGATESTVFTLTPTNDAATEAPESYTVTGTINGQTLTLTGEVRDPSAVGGLGQTFTLTTGIDTMPGLVGSANSTGTDGNDTIVALIDATVANNTLNALDQVNGGLGTNSMTLNMVGAAALPGGITISNVQTINARGSAAVTLDLAANASITGVTALNSTLSTTATLTAATTTDISVSGATDAITIDGGKNITVTDATAAKNITIGATTVNAGTITVTDTKQGTGTIAIDGGTDVTVNASNAAAAGGTIKVGDTTGASVKTDMPTGAVSITSNHVGTAGTDVAMGDITVTGGSTVTVTQTADASKAAADTTGATLTQGDVTVTAGTATTSVTVTQAKSTAEVIAATAVAGVTETASVKFSALTAAQTIVMGGLTFTASTAMTAAEAAAAFSNLVNGTIPVAGDTQSAGPASKGTYTGAFTGWTSGAVSGDTVVFTSTTANSNVGDLTNGGSGSVTITTTAGSAATAAVTGVLGVANGVVLIDDAATAAITTVTVDGYAEASKIGNVATLSKLANLTLANSGSTTAGTATGDMTVDAAGVASLNLTVNNIKGNVSLDGAADNALKTLNLTTSGADSSFALTAAAVETLAIAGTKTATLSTGTFTALKSITLSGSAGATFDVDEADTLTSVNTSATTGKFTGFINGAQATYTGGAGVDNVTLDTGLALTKAIDLGAGNDTLSFAALAVTGSTALLSGGADTDTLSMSATAADGLDATPQTFITNFERLTINATYGDNDNTLDTLTLNLANLGFTNYVTTTGTVADTTTVSNSDVLALDKMASNGTAVLAGKGLVTVNVADATTGPADVLNVINTVADGGTLTAAKVETINLTQNTANGILTLTAADATSLNITASKTLTATLTGSTHLTSIDGSASTAAITVTSVNTTSATTIKGGSGNDVLTAATGTTADVLIGNDGADTLTANAGLATLTGGAGDDLFVIGTASLNSSSYATITDFAAGDLIKMTGADSFAASKVTQADTAVFQDYCNAAVNAIGSSDIAWFQYEGNTYLVMDAAATNSATFINGEDLIVKLTGLVDLTNASFNDTHDTIAL